MGAAEFTSDAHIVITGTSGTGKTCLLEALRARGFSCFEEPVRAALREQLAMDGPALPAKDPQLFVEELLRRTQQDLACARATEGVVFFDRGIPDIVAYAVRFGVEPTALREVARIHRYNERVFVLPPWEQIFVADDFRRATYEVYLEFHRLICQTYVDLGYILVEVPRIGVESRVEFVLASIGRAPS